MADGSESRSEDATFEGECVRDVCSHGQGCEEPLQVKQECGAMVQGSCTKTCGELQRSDVLGENHLQEWGLR